jgi:hypothetical protein
MRQLRETAADAAGTSVAEILGMNRRHPLWALLAGLLLAAPAACDDFGPDLGFNFGSKCTINCPCQKDSDCSAAPCQRAVCGLGGVCGSTPQPDGPWTGNKTKDCAQISCSGGKPNYVLDPDDVPDDRPCASYHCESGGGTSDKPQLVTDPEPDGLTCALDDDGGVGECSNAVCTMPRDAGHGAIEHALEELVSDAGADAAND